MLPKYYMITSDENYNKEAFLRTLAKHLAHGQKLIQLRIKIISLNEFIEVAKESIEQGRKYKATIVLNSDICVAKELNADGVHLTSNRLMSTFARPLPKNKVVSAACHNKEQLLHACKVGVDFVTLSPILCTQTHPKAVPLGWEAFSKITKLIDMPVYALGGLTEKHLQIALRNGACGIAAIRAFWCKKYT